MAKRSRDPIAQALQLRISAAKASCGYTWEQLAAALRQCDVELSPTNLMSKHSRCSYKATELVVLLRLLDVDTLDLSTLQVAGLENAKASLKEA